MSGWYQERALVQKLKTQEARGGCFRNVSICFCPCFCSCCCIFSAGLAIALGQILNDLSGIIGQPQEIVLNVFAQDATFYEPMTTLYDSLPQMTDESSQYNEQKPLCSQCGNIFLEAGEQADQFQAYMQTRAQKFNQSRYDYCNALDRTGACECRDQDSKGQSQCKCDILKRAEGDFCLPLKARDLLQSPREGGLTCEKPFRTVDSCAEQTDACACIQWEGVARNDFTIRVNTTRGFSIELGGGAAWSCQSSMNRAGIRSLVLTENDPWGLEDCRSVTGAEMSATECAPGDDTCKNLGGRIYNSGENDVFPNLQLLLSDFAKAASEGGGNVEVGEEEYIMAIPTARYAAASFLSAISTAGSFVAFGISFGMLGVVFFVGARIIKEREDRLKEGLLSMGTSRFAYFAHWMLWALSVDLFVGLAIGLTPLVLSWLASSATLVEQFVGEEAVETVNNLSPLNPLQFDLVLVGTLMTWNISGIAFALTPFFTVPTNHALVCAVLVVVLAIAPAFDSSGSLLIPSIALKAYFDRSFLYWKFGIGSYFSVMVPTLFLFLDGLLIHVLWLWLENVYPSKGSLELPVWFCLLPSYWQQGVVEKAGPEDVEMSQALESQDRSGGNPATRNLLTVDPAGAAGMETTLSVQRRGSWTEPVGDAQANLVRLGEVVDVKELCVHFRSFGSSNVVRAVDGATMTMFPGEFFCLLGHNGAGKTTTMSVLSGLLKPTSGRVRIFGKHVPKELNQVRKFLGFCPQHNVLFDDLTVQQHMELFAGLSGRDDVSIADMEKLVIEVGLGNRIDVLPDTLSGGMKRKLSVGIAFSGTPKLVVLDEPTSGMDPFSRNSLWDFLKARVQGKIVMFTTHFMDEADALGDRIAIMRAGVVQTCGSAQFLKERYDTGYCVTIVMEDKSAAARERLRVAVAAVLTLAGETSRISMAGVGKEILINIPLGLDKRLPGVLNLLEEGKATHGIGSYGLSMTSLEEVFLKVASGDFASDEQAKEAERLFEEAKRKEDGEEHAAFVLPNPGGTAWQQLVALTIRRFHNSRKDVQGFMCSCLLPIFGVWIACFLSAFSVSESGLDIRTPSVEILPRVSDLKVFEGDAKQYSKDITEDELKSPGGAFKDLWLATGQKFSNQPLNENYDPSFLGMYNKMCADENGLNLTLPWLYRDPDAPSFLESFGLGGSEQPGAPREMSVSMDDAGALNDSNETGNLTTLAPTPAAPVTPAPTPVTPAPTPAPLTPAPTPPPIGERAENPFARCRAILRATADRFSKAMVTEGGSYHIGILTFGPGLRLVAANTSFLAHAVPLALQYLTNGEDNDLTITNHLYPISEAEVQAIETLNLFAEIQSSFLVAILGNFFLCFIPIAVMGFVIMENQKDVKHQLLISGGSARMYWLATFLWDCLIAFPPIFAFYFFLNWYDFKAFLNYSSAAIWVFGLFVPAAVSGAYILATCCDPSRATCCALLCNGLCVLVLVYSFIIMEVLSPIFDGAVAFVAFTSTDVVYPDFGDITGPTEFIAAFANRECGAITSAGPSFDSYATTCSWARRLDWSKWGVFALGFPLPGFHLLDGLTRITARNLIVEFVVPLLITSGAGSIAELASGFVSGQVGTCPEASIGGQSFEQFYNRILLSYKQGGLVCEEVKNELTESACTVSPAQWADQALGLLPLQAIFSTVIALVVNSGAVESIRQYADQALRIVLGEDVYEQFAENITAVVDGIFQRPPLNGVVDIEPLQAQIRSIVESLSSVLTGFLAGYIGDNETAAIIGTCLLVPTPSNNPFTPPVLPPLPYKALSMTIVALAGDLDKRFVSWVQEQTQEPPFKGFVDKLLPELTLSSRQDCYIGPSFGPSNIADLLPDALAGFGALLNTTLGPLEVRVPCNLGLGGSAWDEVGQTLDVVIRITTMGDALLRIALFAFLAPLLLICFEDARDNGRIMKAMTPKTPLPPDMLTMEDEAVLKEKERVNNVDPRRQVMYVKGLRKVFNDGWSCWKAIGCASAKPVHAVRGVTWASDRGMVFGLLGVNGAGKTTSFKMMCGILTPTEGDVRILGIDVVQDKKRARQFIGYCPQFDALVENLTVKEQLYLYARMKGLSGEDMDIAVQSKITEMQLTEYIDRQSGALSGGNKRKLSVAMAIIGEPPVIFLDEPSTGMDPFARRFMWGVIQDVADKREQSVVVLTTHSMEEAQALCSKIGIQVDGQLRCFGSAQQIKDVYGHGYEAHLKFKPSPREVLLQEARKFDIFIPATPQEQVAPDDTSKFHIPDLMSSIDKMYLLQKVKEKAEIIDPDSKEKVGEDPAWAELFADLQQAPFFASDLPAVQANTFLAWSIDHGRMQATMEWLSGDFGRVQRTQMHLPTCRIRLLDMQSAKLGALFEGFSEKKVELGMAQYACEQSSLEQIFNDFAREQENNKMGGVDQGAGTSFTMLPDGQMLQTSSQPLAGQATPATPASMSQAPRQASNDDWMLPPGAPGANAAAAPSVEV